MRMTADEELRRLRERAYGPDADIDRDSVARARLDRLEKPRPVEVRGFRMSVADPDPPRDGDRVSRRAAGLLVAGVALAGIVSTIFVAALSTRLEPTDPITIVATLQPDPTLPWLTQVDSDSRAPDGGVRYADYLGVAVVSVSAGGDGAPCLYVLPSATGGALAGGCGGGPFRPRAVIVVTSDMPPQLTARHPPGTALQFELADGRVIVQAADRYGAGVPPGSAR